MNTLPRAITVRLFDTPDGYQRLRARWREWMSSDQRHRLRAEHHLLYLALLGRDWRRGFRPTFKASKIRGGQFAASGLQRALWIVCWADHAYFSEVFSDTVTADVLARLRPLLAIKPPAVYEPTDWVGGRFPFEAYTVKANDHA